ncbi:MAG: type II toxin-antitoxin system VapC family toxin [Candidatus Sulfotelmatobacter sp.]
MILLDSHVVVWLAADDPRLSTKARAAIEQARRDDRGLAVSDFTLYELSMLFRKKQIGLATSVESFLSEVEKTFTVLPITGRICVHASALPASYPKDPGDRIIGATAIAEGLTLVTADAQIRKSNGVTTVW